MAIGGSSNSDWIFTIRVGNRPPRHQPSLRKRLQPARVYLGRRVRFLSKADQLAASPREHQSQIALAFVFRAVKQLRMLAVVGLALRDAAVNHA
jgi:hypothetical protein